jgi:hypothetical protein
MAKRLGIVARKQCGGISASLREEVPPVQQQVDTWQTLSGVNPQGPIPIGPDTLLFGKIGENLSKMLRY